MSTLNAVWKFFLFFFLSLLTAVAQKNSFLPPLPQSPFEINFNLHQGYTVLKMSQKMVDSMAVGTYMSQPYKGQVRQSFQNAVLSASPKTYPFEYHYYVQPSPDKKHYLVYHYDYSQPTLFAYLKVVDEKGNVQSSMHLAIDNGLTNHGYWIDNQGYVYAIQTDAEDAVFVIRYTSATSDPDWLEIGADVMRRNRFVPFFGEDHTISVAAIVEDANEQWKGVVVGTFDFQKKRLTEVYLYTPSAHAQKSGQKLATGRYEILAFSVQNGQKIISLQKVAILANKYIYNPYAVLAPLDWSARKQQVQYSEKIHVQINQDGKVTERLDGISQAK